MVYAIFRMAKFCSSFHYPSYVWVCALLSRIHIFWLELLHLQRIALTDFSMCFKHRLISSFFSFCFVYFCVFSTHKLLYTNNIWKICKKSIDEKSHIHICVHCAVHKKGERKYNKTKSLFRMRACSNAHTNIVVRNFGILNQALRYRKKNATTSITRIKATWLAWLGLGWSLSSWIIMIQATLNLHLK